MPAEAEAEVMRDTSGAHESRRRIARGGAWNTVAWMVINLSGAVNAILLVRSMRHSEFGVYVLAAAIVGIVASISSLGLAPAIVQLAPRVAGGGASVLRSALRLSALLAAVVALCTGGACLGLVAAHEAGLGRTLAVMIPLAMASPFVASLSGFLQSAQQPKRLSRALLVSPIVLSSAVIALCLHSHPAATWVAAARTGAIAASVLALAVAVHRAGALWSPQKSSRGGVNGAPNAGIGQLSALGASLLGGTLGAVLLAQLDVVVLGFERGHSSVAFYGPASQVADNALTMAATIGTFYLSTIAGVIARNSFDEARELYRWASRWTLVWVSPVIAVGLACPGSLMSVLFGGDYSRMATVLRVLTLGVLVNVLFGFNGLTVDSLNNLRIIVGRQAIGFVFNVVACLIFIPAFGATGAAVATASSLLVINLAASVLLYRHTGITPHNPRLLVTAAVLGVAVALGLALGTVGMPGAARVAIVAIASGLACFLASYLVSAPSERRSIRESLRRHLRGVLGRQPSASAA